MGDTATAVAAPQHLRALEHANRIRLARAELKRRIHAGGLTAAEVLSGSPPEVASMSISELLMSQRGWGRARCRRLLVTLGVPENKRIGTLTERQRKGLCDLLNGRRPERRAPAQDGGLLIGQRPDQGPPTGGLFAAA